MALNKCKMWFNGIKIAFFSQKFTKNRPAAGGPLLPLDRLHSQTRLRPQTPSGIRLNYSTLLYSNTSPNLDIVAF